MKPYNIDKNLIYLSLRRSIAQQTIHTPILAVRQRQLQEPACPPLPAETFLKLAPNENSEHDQGDDDEKRARNGMSKESLFEREQQMAKGCEC